jgi:hypothetical protein
MPVRIDNIQRGNLNQRNVTKWNGFYRALVIDAADPRMLGRVKVRVPDLMPETGTEYTGDWDKNGLWAHSGNSYLGGRNVQDIMGQRANLTDAAYQGSCLIPPAGSWVWVFFENGEPNHPYFFGSLECGQRKVLPENQQGSEWWKKWTLIKTNQGRCIIISDDGDDARIEITGKKRQMNNAPDGDDASIYAIDGNMTTILIDERSGHEKLLIKDYRGNFIKMIQDENGIKDQLHMFFKDDIHIETLKNLYIKTGGNMECSVGNDYALTAGNEIHTKATGGHNEKAFEFNRFALTKDIRSAMTEMRDTSVVMLSHCAGRTMECGSVKSMKMSSSEMDIKSYVVTKIESGAQTDIKSGGEINISGAKTKIQEGAAPATPNLSSVMAEIARTANIAKPDGDRYQTPKPASSPNSIIPDEAMSPPPTNSIPPILGDPYEISVGSTPINTAPPIIRIPTYYTSTPPATPAARLVGVGHMNLLHLKKIYLDTIIPLVDKSYGTYTGFYLFKDITDGVADSDFFDPASIPVYDNYRNPSSTIIDDTTIWWKNLDYICNTAAAYNMTIVPTLFDFCCSPNDPFLTCYPYTSPNWKDSLQGEYIKTVTEHIMRSGVSYILNLGTKYYGTTALPDFGWTRKLVMFLINTCGVPSDKLSLTYGPDINLYEQSPYCRYMMYTGSRSPQTEEINNEEMVDNNSGGVASAAIYDTNNQLIGGYANYIMNCSSDGIACMNTWKMNEFISDIPVGMDISDPNTMNYIFAPKQREAMRIVLGTKNPTNNGYINF